MAHFKMLDPSPPIPNGVITDWDRDRYDEDTTRERSTRLKSMLDPRGPRCYFLKHMAVEMGLAPSPEPQKWDEYQPKVGHLQMGILFHEWILDGEVNWVKCPHNRGTSPWKRVVTQSRGKTVVSEGQDKELREWREALYANPIARKILEDGGFREQVILWDELTPFRDRNGAEGEAMIPCKAALDSLDFNGNIFCIKTTRATDRKEWEWEVRKHHYDFSAAFYDRGRRSIPHLAGTSCTFTHLVVMKESTNTPAACYAFELGEQWLELGCKKVVNSLNRLARCRDEMELIQAEGGDVRDAWPDDIAATQSDPVMPEQWDHVSYDDMTHNQTFTHEVAQ